MHLFVMILGKLQWSQTLPSLAQFDDESDQINIFAVSKFQVDTALLLGWVPIYIRILCDKDTEIEMKIISLPVLKTYLEFCDFWFEQSVIDLLMTT